MKKTLVVFAAIVLALGMTLPASAAGREKGYNSIPQPLPPNVPSEGFECCLNSEFGDQVKLARGSSKVVLATVVMSDWALHSEYPGMDDDGFLWPITLNLYSTPAHAAAHDADLGTWTQDFLIPWRPEADPTCTNGTAWRAENGLCYNGYAFKITFNLRNNQDCNPKHNKDGLTLPETFIYGIAYNTAHTGYAPNGINGPYNSLNIGLNSTGTVPGDVDTNVVWRSANPTWSVPGGAFEAESGWSPYTPAIKFTVVGK